MKRIQKTGSKLAKNAKNLAKSLAAHEASEMSMYKKEATKKKPKSRKKM